MTIVVQRGILILNLLTIARHLFFRFFQLQLFGSFSGYFIYIQLYILAISSVLSAIQLSQQYWAILQLFQLLIFQLYLTIFFSYFSIFSAISAFFQLFCRYFSQLNLAISQLFQLFAATIIWLFVSFYPVILQVFQIK